MVQQLGNLGGLGVLAAPALAQQISGPATTGAGVLNRVLTSFLIGRQLRQQEADQQEKRDQRTAILTNFAKQLAGGGSGAGPTAGKASPATAPPPIPGFYGDSAAGAQPSLPPATSSAGLPSGAGGMDYSAMIDSGDPELIGYAIDALTQQRAAQRQQQQAMLQAQLDSFGSRQKHEQELEQISLRGRLTGEYGLERERIAQQATAERSALDRASREQTAAARDQAIIEAGRARASGVVDAERLKLENLGSAEKYRREVSPLEKKRDESYAASLDAFEQTGGFVAAEANIAKIEDVIGVLEQSPNLTGLLQGAAPDLVRAGLFPETTAIHEQIASVAYQSLRQTLGAQFTEKEGERLMNTFFNPKLSTQENIRRLGALAEVLKGTVDQRHAMEDHIQQNIDDLGFASLKGYRVSTDSVASVRRKLDQALNRGRQTTRVVTPEVVPAPAPAGAVQTAGPGAALPGQATDRQSLIRELQDLRRMREQFTATPNTVY